MYRTIWHQGKEHANDMLRSSTRIYLYENICTHGSQDNVFM